MQLSLLCKMCVRIVYIENIKKTHGCGAGREERREQVTVVMPRERNWMASRVVVASIEPWQTINRLSSSPHYQQTDYFESIDDPVVQTWMRVMSKKVAKVAKVIPVLLLT